MQTADVAKEFDFGKKKAFPVRDQHYFASIHKAQKELGWKPRFGLVDGLKDSYEKVTWCIEKSARHQKACCLQDFGRGTYRKEPDFGTDDMILEKMQSKVRV